MTSSGSIDALRGKLAERGTFVIITFPIINLFSSRCCELLLVFYLYLESSVLQSHPDLNSLL